MKTIFHYWAYLLKKTWREDRASFYHCAWLISSAFLLTTGICLVIVLDPLGFLFLGLGMIDLTSVFWLPWAIEQYENYCDWKDNVKS